jgi:3'5'-cyclic nucleotide phosphodiesterase
LLVCLPNVSLEDDVRFCAISRGQNVLDEVDRMVLIVAAIMHDLDHLGRTNPFLINSQHQLALLYNDL